MRNRIDRLTNLQVSFLVSSTIIGVTVLSLPRIAAELAKAAGPITTLITGILMALVLVIIALFAKRFPNDTIIEYSAELIGFIPSKILGLIFYIYFLGVASVILRLFCDTIKVNLLEITPLEIIMLTFLFASIYVAINGVSSLARLCETFEPLVIGAMGLVIILSFKNFNFEELLPAFKQDVLSWIYPIPSIALSYFGFEILLFITPFTKEPNKVLKYGLIGILPAILLYSAFVTVCIGTCGAEVTSHTIYPALQLAKYIAFPGAFAERFDIFFMIFWVLGSYTSLSSYFYLASLSITKTLGLRNYRPFVILNVPLIYMLGLVPQNKKEIFQFSRYVSYMGVLVLAIVVLLFIMAVVLKKGRGKNEQKA